MTDNEIVKAWGKVLNNSDEPIGEHWMVFVTTQMAKETFDMLTRQKAEIERLQHILVSFMSEVENWEHKHGIDTSNIPKIAVLGTEKENCIKQAKSEAYREFWMKLRTHGHKMMGSDWSGEFCAISILVEDGDKLLIELTESNE